MMLNRPRPSDLGDLCRMEQDPRTMEMLLGVRTPEQTAAMLGRIQSHWDQHGFGWWIARDRRSGNFLGRGGLRRVTLGTREEVEVGYGFVASVWGQGFATELALESLKFGWEVLKLTSMVSFTLPTNIASRRVMEKCGLRFEGEGEWAGLPHVFYRTDRRPLAD